MSDSCKGGTCPDRPIDHSCTLRFKRRPPVARTSLLCSVFIKIVEASTILGDQLEDFPLAVAPDNEGAGGWGFREIQFRGNFSIC
jgi:hypothetical protein